MTDDLFLGRMPFETCIIEDGSERYATAKGWKYERRGGKGHAVVDGGVKTGKSGQQRKETRLSICHI